jgi:hypothetical protein
MHYKSPLNTLSSTAGSSASSSPVVPIASDCHLTEPIRHAPDAFCESSMKKLAGTSNSI